MSPNWIGKAALAVSSAVACFLCTSAIAIEPEEPIGREALHATLWMQIAPEYRANVLQVYQLAGERIAVPSTGSAATEQSGVAPDVLAKLPTAVILDLDETVLDNTVYQARLIRDHAAYNATSWGAWVGAGKADALPGARESIPAAVVGRRAPRPVSIDDDRGHDSTWDRCAGGLADHASHCRGRQSRLSSSV